MRSKSILVVVVLFVAVGQGFGVVRYEDGGTYDITTTINDDVWVDYLAPGMQTTVNLLGGGSIYNGYLRGYTDSHINIAGGSVGQSLEAKDNSQAMMSGGSIGLHLNALDNSQVTMSGGTVSGHFDAIHNSRVIMSGGSVGGNLSVQDTCQLTMSGGTIGGWLGSMQNSKVTMSGGSVGENLNASHNGQVRWIGGTVGTDLTVTANGQLIIDGFDFAINGVSVDYGEITSISGGTYVGLLTGTLANSDIINNQFIINDTSSIILTPEPSTLLLLGLGAVMLRRKRRKGN